MRRSRLVTAQLAVLALLLSACDRDDGHLDAGPSLDPASLPGAYAGTFPCHNCPGVEVALWLRRDRVFFLRQDYLGAPDEATVRTHGLGHWAWDTASAQVVLSGRGPDRVFAYDAGRLRMQTLSVEPYLLERDETIGTFTDRMTLEGRYDSAADIGTFMECTTGLTFVIQDDASGQDLRRRHRSVSAAERTALVSIEGHLVGVEAEANGREVLAVDRFVSIRPGSSC